MSRLVARFAFATLLAWASACSRNVGDSCSANVDCAPQGTRFCDTSAPGGYCTIDGCDVSTCPDEAVCVRFFTLLVNTTCLYDPAFPTGRGLQDANGNYACRADERCLCDNFDAKAGVCAGQGRCAPETSERRWCQYRCSSNSDCRAGYECRSTGTLGAEPVPKVEDAGVKLTPAKFCAPRGLTN